MPHPTKPPQRHPFIEKLELLANVLKAHIDDDERHRALLQRQYSTLLSELATLRELLDPKSNHQSRSATPKLDSNNH